MPERKGIYFVSDVHLGLQVGDPAGREARFVAFLRFIPAEGTRALYLLHDVFAYDGFFVFSVVKRVSQPFFGLFDISSVHSDEKSLESAETTVGAGIGEEKVFSGD